MPHVQATAATPISKSRDGKWFVRLTECACAGTDICFRVGGRLARRLMDAWLTEVAASYEKRRPSDRLT